MIYHRKRKGRSLHNRGCDQSLIRKYFLMNGNGWNYRVFDGASDVTRTHDLLITNQLLYRLSYTSTFLTACTFYHMSPWMSTKKFDDYYLFSCMKKCRISAQAVDFFRFLSVVQNLHCYTPRKTRAVSGFPARGEDQSSYIFVTICLHNFLPASGLL